MTKFTIEKDDKKFAIMQDNGHKKTPATAKRFDSRADAETYAKDRLRVKISGKAT